MALGKITKSAVDRLAPGGEWLWDTQLKGFGARRQIDGVFYALRYRLAGRQIIKSLGRHGHLTPELARTMAKEKLGRVAVGADPFAEDAKARTAETFGAEVERYLERKKALMKSRAFQEVERHLMNHAKPLHRLRLSEIDRRTIAVLLAEIETASGFVARNRVRSTLSAFFNWAITEGFNEINPVTGTAKADEGGSRERVLNPAELSEVWRSLPQDHFGDIVRLLILTGRRREEIGGLRWSEVNLPEGLLTLPPERTKNKRLHQLPLSPQASAILERQLRRNDRDLIFGIGKGGFSGWSDCKARLDAATLAKRREADPKAKPMPDWRLHDLRRTVATGMAEGGTLPHIVEAVLNHISGHKAGVAGVYNLARYLAEMREALTNWANYVSEITSALRPKGVAVRAAPFERAEGPRASLAERLARVAK